MLLPRDSLLLAMNTHPIRAALPENSIPDTSSSIGDGPSSQVVSSIETPASTPASTWPFPPDTTISPHFILVVNILVLIIAITCVMVLIYHVQRQYRHRKLLAMIAKTQEIDDLDNTQLSSSKTKESSKTNLAEKFKIKMTPLRGLRFGRKKKANHVRWGSESDVWNADVGWEGWETKGHEKSKSLDRHLAACGVGKEYVIEGDERQTRINLRAANGCDTFRGS